MEHKVHVNDARKVVRSIGLNVLATLRALNFLYLAALNLHDHTAQKSVCACNCSFFPSDGIFRKGLQDKICESDQNLLNLESYSVRRISEKVCPFVETKSPIEIL